MYLRAIVIVKRKGDDKLFFSCALVRQGFSHLEELLEVDIWC